SRNQDCCFSFIKKRRKRKLSQSVDGYIWPEPQYFFLPGEKSSLYQRKTRAWPIFEILSRPRYRRVTLYLTPEISKSSAHITLLTSLFAVYFETVHPIYPFLCPSEFQRQASSSDLSNLLATDKAFAALYYAIVAIGCQHNEGGSYEAGIGEAWSYFGRSMSHFQDLILARGSLPAVQVYLP
ncbi:hypothetical protein N7481_005045, partial [Penicillium waksmanii]|uniref:uncharacterized protein n=1 Tax=Penicillium waksmanii TaxID=69791 RepID=UPI0025491D0A